MSAGSIKKYAGKQKTDDTGTPLHWPGTMDGFPVRSPVAPATTQKEFEDIPLVYDAKGKFLELPAQMAEYLDIIDKAANGWYQLRHEKFLGWDAEKKIQYMFIQWLEIYGEPAASKSSLSPV